MRSIKLLDWEKLLKQWPYTASTWNHPTTTTNEYLFCNNGLGDKINLKMRQSCYQSTCTCKVFADTFLRFKVKFSFHIGSFDLQITIKATSEWTHINNMLKANK